MYTNKNCRRRIGTLRTCPYAGANTVTAGDCFKSECIKSGFAFSSTTALAQADCPIQEYRTGLCPCTALEKGTYFPELVM